MVQSHLPYLNPAGTANVLSGPFNKPWIIARHYFNRIPSVEYLADKEHAPSSEFPSRVRLHPPASLELPGATVRPSTDDGQKAIKIYIYMFFFFK